MSAMYYVVRYSGAFGFIKPWTAVRDLETYSQQFLTPSIVEGLRQKLEVGQILRHRLSHEGFSHQQERTQSRGWEEKRGKKGTKTVTASRNQSILVRWVLLNPTVHLAFATRADAEIAHRQHVCLCRNEDILLPHGSVMEMTPEEFEEISGFELLFGRGDAAFLVGYNRFDNNNPMYGTLVISGNPTSVEPIER